MWPPAVSVFALSFLRYRGWRKLEQFATLLPSREKLVETGRACLLACLRMALSRFSFSAVQRWVLKKRAGRRPPPTHKKREELTPPPESSPATSPRPTTSGQPFDSLLIPCAVGGLVDVPAPSIDVSVRTGIPRETTCESDDVFLVVEFTIPLGEEACERSDTESICLSTELL